MRQRNHSTVTYPIAFVASLLLFGSSAVYSQTRPAPPPPDERPSKSDKDDLGSDIGSHEREMRAKLAIREEKKQYDENVARAKETSDIATQILVSYQTRRSFTVDDHKKLERLEKLARRIRNEAGGSEAATDLKEIPAVIETAVKRMAEMAEDLRKEVEKTPRHVVSAAVIDQANKLIAMIQFMRDQAR